MADTRRRDAVNLEAIQTTFYRWKSLMPKILIIDDDTTITDLLKTLMRMEGHTPTTLNDSTKALELAGALDPDLITLDLMMPGLTGFELCELLHQDPKFARIPIIVVSARDDHDDRY